MRGKLLCNVSHDTEHHRLLSLFRHRALGNVSSRSQAEEWQSRVTRQQAVDEFLEFGIVNRLRNISIASGIECQVVKIGCVVRRDDHDWYFAQLPSAANLARGGDSIDERQAQIHQDDLGPYFKS